MSLPIIRSLGKKGVYITAVFGRGKFRSPYQSIISESKFIKEKIFFDETDYEDSLISVLCEYGKKQEIKPVIFLASDTDLQIISKNRDKLSGYYHFSLPPHNLIEKLLHKEDFIDLAIEKGFDIPYSVKIQNFDELEEITRTFNFPFIIKPSWRDNDWLNKFKEKKLFLINSLSDLKAFQETAANLNCNFLVQQLISGSEENIYCTFSIVDKNSDIIQMGCCRKIRQYPKNFGNTSVAQTCSNGQVEKLTESVIKKLNAVGYISIEYKYDPNDNKYKIIEITPNRFNRQFLVTDILGLNLPYTLYLMELGHIIEYSKTNIKKGNWLSEVNEIRTFKNYRNEFRFLNYFNTLLHTRRMEIFSITDPKPFLKLVSDSFHN